MNGFWMTVSTALLLSFWGGYLLTGWMFQPLQQAFVQAGFVRPNFRGQPIPVGMGAALWLGLFFTAGLLLLLSEWLPLPWLMVQDLVGLLVVATGFFVIGLLDDAIGDRSATGLRGHLRQFFVKREVTTGLLKAVVGVFIGVIGAWLMGAYGWRLPLGGLMIALSANSVNLLDLRPGRACKGVLFSLGAVALLSLRGLESPAFWLLLGVTLSYIPHDLQARAMMGDAGSNLLGGGIGLLIVTTCSITMTAVWLGLLLLFHLYAEKYSLSEAIEKNRLLRWLDVLGRSA